MQENPQMIKNANPIPHIPLPFKEVIADVLKVKPEPKPSQPTLDDQHLREGNRGLKPSDRRPFSSSTKKRVKTNPKRSRRVNRKT